MTGGISLEKFIKQVKDELVAAQNTSGDPFYELENVQLEVTFSVEAGGGTSFKLIVAEIGGQAKASQTHKVVLTLKPLKKSEKADEASPLTSSASAGADVGPVYVPGQAASVNPADMSLLGLKKIEVVEGARPGAKLRALLEKEGIIGRQDTVDVALAPVGISVGNK